jgi:hypothetical protein
MPHPLYLKLGDATTSKPPQCRALLGSAIEMKLLRDIRYPFNNRLVLSTKRLLKG